VFAPDGAGAAAAAGAAGEVVHLPALLAAAFGISTSEARRAIAQGAVRIDGEPVQQGTLDVDGPAVDGRVLQLGRRRFARVRLAP
jgi:tyrosyl-tRNA synthetase